MVVLTSFPPPSEGVKHVQDQTSVQVGQRALGNGTLYIAESRVSWVGEAGHGFSLEYSGISLHAVSKDLTAFPHEHLYLMCEGNLDRDEQEHDADHQSDEDDSQPLSEVRFVPSDKTSLEPMYKAMCECQALHPDDEQDSLSEEDDFYGDENGEEELTEEGQARLQNLENIFSAGDSGYMEEPVVGRQPHNGQGDNEEPMDQTQFEDAE